LTVGFDGDDTLWHNEGRFHDAQRHLRQVLAPYAIEEDLKCRLLAIERRNLRLFGYGVKGFTLSMIETAIELSKGRIAAAEIARLIDLGKEMLEAPIEILPGVHETLERITADGRQLLLITKGDLFDQESRVARSGLADLFDAIEVVSEKDETAYRRVLHRHRVEPAEFLMVGNSVRSDVLPVLAVGGAAALVPYPLLWEHEVADVPSDGARFVQLTGLADLPPLIGA
jgi:putative hydrolase of the HAD superfamily